MSATSTATGILNWPAPERRSDRYGVIGLYANDFAGTVTAIPVVNVAMLRDMAGKRVSITAKVLETRQSGHIGDLFRGIFPSTPEVGQVFALGTGTLFVKDIEESPIGIGIQPDDDRNSDWFDPHVLYQLHDQTVAVTITEIDG